MNAYHYWVGGNGFLAIRESDSRHLIACHCAAPHTVSWRQQFGLFHGDPHPGNIFALPDGRIAYCDFGNVAELSSGNKQTLIDAVVHAVNEDYFEMAQDFIKLVRAPERPSHPCLRTPRTAHTRAWNTRARNTSTLLRSLHKHVVRVDAKPCRRH